MKLLRLTALLACIGVLALVVAGCGSDDNSSSDGKTTASGTSAKPSGPIKIAGGLAVTGGFAFFDEPALAGLKLGVKEINAKGGLLGHPVELDVKDVRSDPSQAVIATKGLLDKKPTILLAACMTDAAIPQGRLGQKAEVPTISTCATAPNLTTSVGNYMFGNFVPDNFESTATADYAKSQGYKTAFTLTSTDSAYTSNVPKAFKNAFDAGGGKVVGDASYALDQQDFSAAIGKIKSAKPDVIETAMFEPAFPAFMKQLRGAGVDTPVIGAGGIDTASVVGGGKVMEGLVFPTQGFAKDGNDLAQFNERIRKASGKDAVNLYAARGYALTQIIAAAVKAANSDDPKKIRDALANLKDVPTLGTTTSFAYEGANGLPLINPISINKVENGKKTLAEEITVNPADVPKVD
jgi:branched-chain amino acid transport system substrate-binding protein